MRTCPHCQSANPSGHKFCQSCGRPLLPIKPTEKTQAGVVANQAKTHIPLQATLLPAGAVAETESQDAPPEEPLMLRSETYLGSTQRYRIVTVLSEKTALVEDTQLETRSPLQTQISQLETPSLSQLQAIPELPSSVYPYYLLTSSAPSVYDAWEQKGTIVVVTRQTFPPLTSILQSFATTAAALNHVYWLYSITELWVALDKLPKWRSSLLLADHLGIDSEYSVQVRRFATPSQPPDFAQLQAFLRSLFATVSPHSQIEPIARTLSSATTLQQLRSELSSLGTALLDTPASLPLAKPTPISEPAPRMALNTASNMAENIPPENTAPMSPTSETALPPTAAEAGNLEAGNLKAGNLEAGNLEAGNLEAEEIELLGDPSDSSDSDEATMVLPMRLIDISEAGRTDVGRQRDYNEDCFFIRSSTQKHADNRGQVMQAHSLYVLCDGMGGHDGGEVASRLAAETLSDYFTQHWPHPIPGQSASPLPTEAVIKEAVQLANQAIFEINEKEQRAGHERMGTTLVMVLLQGAEAVVAHVGDSRLYKYARRAGLQQMTIDHEVGQREIQRGIPYEIAYARPDAYQLTQALGPRGNEEVLPSVSYLSFSEDALLLLCSDGLSDNNLVEDYLESHIDPILRGRKDIDAGIDELMTLANEVNGHDNISAIAIRVKVSPDLSTMRNKPPRDRGLTVIQ